jgi:hypothetical protein
MSNSEVRDEFAGCLAVVAFIGAWAYCTLHYGFLLGFGLGWLPSIILALLVRAMWPLALVVAAISLVLCFKP